MQQVRVYLRRVILAAILGGLAGVAFTVLTYSMRSSIEVRFDRDLPPQIGGFFPVERSDRGSFAWTTATAELRLPGLDRREPWIWTINARGARPDPRTFPDVTFAVDGVALAARRLGNTFERVSVEVPVRSTDRGATLTIHVRPTFSPGSDDPRALGIQIDELTIAPAPTAVVVVPPRQVLAAASLNAAVFGAAFGLLGVTPGSAVGGAIALAAAQSVPLTSGFGPFTPYPAATIRLAVWIAALLVVLVLATERLRQQTLRNTARFASAFSAGVLFLYLLGLLHPEKAIVDAVFHAHRLESVLAGGFYFTQPMPSGVRFPYAIALYVFTAPWTVFTRDHVTLLRIVVCSAHVIAGLSLYPAIVRTWGDRLTAAMAVALFHFIPVSYAVLGNANMTNVFGTAAAVVTVVAASIWPLWPRDTRYLIALTILAALALLSHVSTFALLLTTLFAIACFYAWGGGSLLRAPARSILVAAVAAAVLAIVTYYGHFLEAYQGLARVRGQAVVDGSAGTPLLARIGQTFTLTVAAVGWPTLLLSVVGLWRVWQARLRDRLVFALAGWGATFVVFVAFAALTRVDVAFERYAAEFVGRVVHTTFAAAVILAASGAASSWRAGGWLRAGAVATLVAAVAVAVRNWLLWLS